jgi:hypothetical protein
VILKLTDAKGLEVFIDNEGEKLGHVRIWGDEPLRTEIDHNINTQFHIFKGQLKYIRASLGDNLIIYENGKPPVINQAKTDYFLKYFIPVVVPAFGLTAEIIEEDKRNG